MRTSTLCKTRDTMKKTLRVAAAQGWGETCKQMYDVSPDTAAYWAAVERRRVKAERWLKEPVAMVQRPLKHIRAKLQDAALTLERQEKGNCWPDEGYKAFAECYRPFELLAKHGFGQHLQIAAQVL